MAKRSFESHRKPATLEPSQPPKHSSARNHWHFRQRRATEKDSTAFSEWIIREGAIPSAFAPTLPDLLARLLRERTLIGHVVEDGLQKSTLAAFGLAGFLDQSVVDDYLAKPTGRLVLTLLDRANRNQNPTFLTYSEIAQANAGERLALVPLFWLQRETDFASQEGRELLLLAHDSFVTVFRGYRLTSILREASSERAQTYLAAGFREIKHLPHRSKKSTAPAQPSIFYATRHGIEESLPGSAIAPLFSTRPPVFSFTEKQQQIMELALQNMTNRDIANALATTTNAIAQHWRKVQARIEFVRPHLLGTDRISTGARGQEKRRQILAYLAEHVEELRPYRKNP